MEEDMRLSVDASNAVNEPLYATIKPAKVWFLIEYNGAFTFNAWDDAHIEQAVKDRLNNYPDSHTLLIRQPGQASFGDGRFTMYIAHAGAEEAALYKFMFRHYDDILDLDLDNILAGNGPHPLGTHLYLICTNGKRDVCCSQFGIPVYNAMANIAQGAVWQSSHIGGHRFAATALCFPHALCYGRLQPNDAAHIIGSYRQGKIVLDKWRGHAIMDKPLQAAEYFLRRALDEDGIAALRLLDYTAGDERWSARFKVQQLTYRVNVRAAEALEVLTTTGDSTHKAIPQFELLNYERED